MIGLRPYIYGGVAVLAVLALWFAYNRGVNAEHSNWQKAQAAEQVERAKQQAANNAITARRLIDQKEIAENAVQERDQARIDATASADAGERLRQQVRNLTLSIAASNPGATRSSETANATIDMLAQLQQRNDEATDAIARYADEASIAGRVCEASYAALLAK